MKTDKKELIAAAKIARTRAYSPYSDFSVGAALLCDDGTVYEGCNIENASYTPTCCAERVAIFRAIADGKRNFSAIAVVGGKSAESETDFCYPCGVCRQVISEFCSDDFQIILSNGKGELLDIQLRELLPYRFKLDTKENYEKAD
ncbi:MAG: cytidine deaminase [Ruminococcaceae bacterium]|nr:cytidine deaminase [Oscillospiraceae bacterium]